MSIERKGRKVVERIEGRQPGTKKESKGKWRLGLMTGERKAAGRKRKKERIMTDRKGVKKRLKMKANRKEMRVKGVLKKRLHGGRSDACKTERRKEGRIKEGR